MKFLDEVKIFLKSGNGGPGAVSFRREANVPYGKYKAIKISHQTIDSERINSLWLAPELNFIPIKLTQTENGKTNFEANLTQLNY